MKLNLDEFTSEHGLWMGKSSEPILGDHDVTLFANSKTGRPDDRLLKLYTSFCKHLRAAELKKGWEELLKIYQKLLPTLQQELADGMLQPEDVPDVNSVKDISKLLVLPHAVIIPNTMRGKAGNYVVLGIDIVFDYEHAYELLFLDNKFHSIEQSGGFCLE